jgi:arylsulfatase A-like enzyme
MSINGSLVNFRALAMRIPSLIATAVGLVALASCATPPEPATQAASPSKRPNVIVIIADDLGYGDISSFGGRIATPNIDLLAKSGARMTSGYVTAAVCAPSRAALLAGRQQTRFGFEFNPVGRDERLGMALSETTIAQTMKSAGYRTGIVGKWHIGQSAGFHPLDRGFDSFYGILGGGTPYWTQKAPNDLHIVTAEDSRITRERLPVFDGRDPVDPGGYITDIFTDEAIDFIQEGQSSPFFLYLAYTAPHTPLQATEKYLARISNPKDEYDHVYRAMVTSLDDGVGRVIATLKQQGLYENTLIFFISDNGCASYVGGACSNGELSGWKGFPWDGGIRVPYLVSWPARFGASVQSAPVSSLDIAATAAAAAGVRHEGAEGVDLASALASGTLNMQRALFWRMGPTHIVRRGQWKMIVVNKTNEVLGAGDDLARSLRPDGMPAAVSPLGQWVLLYDLSTDPGEKINLADRRPEIVQALQRDWEAWNTRNVSPQWTSRRSVIGQVNDTKVELFN